MNKLYLYFLAFVESLCFIMLLNAFASRLKLVDVPSERKVHEGEIPLTGGVAMFITISSMLFFSGTQDAFHASLFPALLLIVVTGVCDDLFDLSPGSRFVVQAVATLMMIYFGGVMITDLGDLFGGGVVHFNMLSVPFTIFCVIGVINAINMLDGIDGLAGGVVFTMFLLFGCMALQVGNDERAMLAFLVASSVLGFIFFNMRSPWRSKATVFMGDSGSMMLGFLVAWLAIDLTQEGARSFTPITAVWILAIPLLDTVTLMFRRMLMGRSLFAPDHEHLHHILLRAGFSVWQTTVLIVLLSFGIGLVGVFAYYCGVDEYIMFYAFMALFVLYVAVVCAISRLQGRIECSEGGDFDDCAVKNFTTKNKYD